MPPRVQASASCSTSAVGAGLGSNGPIVVSPLTSHCTWPGSTTRPAGKVVPRITRSTCCASASSLPTPFCTEQTEPFANAPAVAGWQLGGVRRRAELADDLARSGEAQPVLVHRRDVLPVEIERPDLDVVELRKVRREQRPDCSAADDRHPHRYDASRPLTRR